MEDDNDIEEITEVDNEASDLDIPEDLPIMQLFKRLISNDNKQNTVLTNAQIISILGKEFDMDITSLHDLEVDVYLNIMKKFLKDWPEWDEFDRVINRLKSAKAYTSIKKVLDHKYKNLKEYLGVMLEATKVMVQSKLKESIKDLECSVPSMSKESKESVDTPDVIMELSCTRDQLNQLFFRNPESDTSTSVFNYTDNLQNRIVLNTWNIESILNMWDIKVAINLNFLICKRETTHILKHILVNKKHSPSSKQSTILNNNLQGKLKKTKEIKKIGFFKLLDRILQQYTNNMEVYMLLGAVFTLMKHDYNLAPDVISMPGMYRQHSNKYAYVRYLYADSKPALNSQDMKYDLQIEETISPMHQFFLSKVESMDSLLPPFQEWFNISCGYCKVKFSGMDALEMIKAHFDEHHQNEPDWWCTNCGTRFKTKYLAEVKWFHNC